MRSSAWSSEGLRCLLQNLGEGHVADQSDRPLQTARGRDGDPGEVGDVGVSEVKGGKGLRRREDPELVQVLSDQQDRK